MGRLAEPEISEGGLESDQRWLLALRIAASPPFQKAERLRSLLLFLVHESLRGNGTRLTEQRIGHSVFGKPADYSPSEDSSVRANARLLRLRLHEYYDSYGRGDPFIVDLPKGSYALVFRPAETPAPPTSVVPPAPPATEPAPEPVPPPRIRRPRALSIPLVAGIAVLCFAAGYLASRFQPAFPPPPWPLSEVYDSASRTQVVLSDINYGLFRLISGRHIPLDEYLGSGYPESTLPAGANARESHLASHLSRTSFVSYADCVLTNRLLAAFGGREDRIWVRSARDLKPHDLSEGNFIFVGSPASNPWVSLFTDRLNFVEEKAPGTQGSIVNRHPRPGENQRYVGIARTGSAGEDYASIALLPSASGRGTVLILEGLQQEGTEAAGLLMSTAEGRAKLRSALNLSPGSRNRVFFEALIRSKTVGGSTAGTEIVSVRSWR